MSSKTARHKPLEIVRTKDGALDEIICAGAYVHLEQMANNHWWMVVSDGKNEVHVNFGSSAPIKAEIMMEQTDAG